MTDQLLDLRSQLTRRAERRALEGLHLVRVASMVSEGRAKTFRIAQSRDDAEGTCGPCTYPPDVPA